MGSIANFNQSRPGCMSTVMIALCCHHRCEWKFFVGQENLVDSFGLETINEFNVLCGLTSWATCGSGKPRQRKRTPGSEDGSEKQDLISDEDTTKKETDDSKVPSDSEAVVGRYDRLRLDRCRRESVGRKVKRILDFARCRFIRERCGLSETEMVYYCDTDLSLENVVLLAKSKNASSQCQSTNES